MTPTGKRILIATAIAAVILIAAFIFWPEKEQPTTQPAGSSGGGNGDKIRQITGKTGDGGNEDNGGGQSKATTQKAPKEQSLAVKNYERGMELVEKGDAVRGRVPLSAALLSGELDQQRATAARKKLTDLADKIVFSRKIYDGDPYVEQYFIQPGETLAGKNGVVRRKNLRVPALFILKINGISDARNIRAGQALKLIKGPVHAVIDKSKFTMDLYLHREGLPKIYVKRLSVGVGKNGTTPAGLWRVELGSKMKFAPWNPPATSEHTRAIKWGDPDYPLGKMGYWIGLEGIDENTRNHNGYGIHGTDEPESVGKAQSLGCIRLLDKDIDLVYSMLYEKWSTVLIKE